LDGVANSLRLVDGVGATGQIGHELFGDVTERSLAPPEAVEIAIQGCEFAGGVRLGFGPVELLNLRGEVARDLLEAFLVFIFHVIEFLHDEIDGRAEIFVFDPGIGLDQQRISQRRAGTGEHQCLQLVVGISDSTTVLEEDHEVSIQSEDIAAALEKGAHVDRITEGAFHGADRGIDSGGVAGRE